MKRQAPRAKDLSPEIGGWTHFFEVLPARQVILRDYVSSIITLLLPLVIHTSPDGQGRKHRLAPAFRGNTHDQKAAVGAFLHTGKVANL